MGKAEAGPKSGLNGPDLADLVGLLTSLLKIMLENHLWSINDIIIRRWSSFCNAKII